MTEVCLVNVGVLPGSSSDTLMLTNPDRDAGGHGHRVVRQPVVSTKHQNWFHQVVISFNRKLIHSVFPHSLSGNSGEIRSVSRGAHEIQNKVCLSYSEYR